LEEIDHGSISYPFAPVRPERLSRKKDHLAYITEKLERLDEKVKTEEELAKAIEERKERHDRELSSYPVKGSSKLATKLRITMLDEHKSEIECLKQSYGIKIESLQQDNEDEFSVADSLNPSAFVNSAAMPATTLGLPVDTELPSLPLSPRTTYLDSCIRHGLNPRSSLILRKVKVPLIRSIEIYAVTHISYRS